MYYTVAEVAKLMDLSKVSIYNKLKLKELEQYILKNKGITYVSEEGLSCLKSSLNFKDIAAEEIASGLNENDINQDEVLETQGFRVGLNFKEDYINTLKLENQKLWQQLDEKDKQIQDLISLNKNSQILLKQQSEKDPLLLEEKFNSMEDKLEGIKNRMELRKEEEKQKKDKGFWDIFKSRND